MKNISIYLLFFISYSCFSQSKTKLNQIDEVDTVTFQIWEKAKGFIDQNDYQSALKIYRKLLNRIGSVYGKDNLVYVEIIGIVVYLNIELGNYTAALSLSIKAEGIAKELFGEKSPQYALHLNNLAVIYQSMGNYPKALSLAKLAVQIKEHNFGKHSEETLKSLTNLGSIYLKLNQYNLAEELFGEVIVSTEKVFGKENYLIATAVQNLATIYQYRGEFERAITLYNRSLKVKEKIHGKESLSYLRGIYAITHLYQDLNKHEKAIPLLKENLVVIERLLGRENKEFAKNLNALARAYEKIGNNIKAIYLYEEIFDIYKRILNENNPSYRIVLTNLTRLYESHGNATKSVSIQKKINEKLIQAIRINLGEVNQIIREDFARKIRSELSNSQSLSLRHPQSSDLKEQNFCIQLLTKSNSLFNHVILIQALQKSEDPEVQKNAEKWKEILEILSREYPKKHLGSSHMYDSLKVEAFNLENELLQVSSSFRELIPQISWRDIQSRLKQGEVAIEIADFKYFSMDNTKPTDSIYYVCYLIKKNAKELQMIYLFEEKELKKQLSAVLANNTNIYNYRGVKGVVPTNNHHIKDLILKPLESSLKDVKTIYYSPSGLLNRINISAIPIDSSLMFSDRFDLIQMNNIRQLTDLSKTILQSKAILLGGIDYGDFIQRKKDDSNLTSKDEIFPKTNKISWDYLIGTEKETKSIKNILSKNGFQVILKSKQKANETYFKKIGVKQPSPRILHIATHGYFYPSPNIKNNSLYIEQGPQTASNPLIRSGLILANGNKSWLYNTIPKGEEDNILTAYEIAQMNLRNTELVVLSACETGLGDIIDNEGVYGLQRAFKMAGAKNVIMSLWKVPDAETQELMTTFYSNWMQGQSIHDAFYGAQKVMREKYMEEPYKWAGFVLME